MIQRKKKAAILANCQGQSIAHLLKKNDVFAKAFDLLPLNPIHLLKESDAPKIHELVSSLDLLIHQPIGPHYGVFSSDNIVKSMKPDSCSISFPVLFFSGYNPETVYMKNIAGKTIQEMGYNDLNIMKLFLAGFSPQDIVDQIISEDFYSHAFILNNYEQSINSLKEREKDLDVKISQFINNFAKERRLFFSMNHPTNEVLQKVTAQILSLLSIPFVNLNLPKELLGKTRLFVYPSVRNILGLSWNDSIMVDLKSYTLEDYVARFVTLYEKNIELVTQNVEIARNGVDPFNQKSVKKTPNQKDNSHPYKLNNTAILVLGMHRSGTSAVTGVLQMLDVYLGSDLMPPQSDNPKGFYEHNTISEMNEEILKTLGSCWDDPGPLPLDRIQTAQTSSIRNRLKTVLLEEFGQSELWALKDPRLCRLLNLWLPLLDELGVEVKILFSIRHPAEVSDSLQARNKIAPEHSALLWLRYFLEGESLSRKFPRTFIAYSDVLRDWQSCFRQVEIDLNIKWPKSILKAEGEIDEFLETSLRHHVMQDKKKWHNPSFFQQTAQSVYEAVVSGGKSLSLRTLDEINDNLVHFDEKAVAYHEYFNVKINGIRTEMEKTQKKLEETRNELEKTRNELEKTRKFLNGIPMNLHNFIKFLGNVTKWRS